ncbi:amidase [Planococcus sp. YIM B11945]|uniref:amidase n=1 Tax=Planococcus sp. YIM B11945 TaxID=3435410 RepID=UPI003D7D8326
MTDLAFLNASQLAPMIEKKELSPVELTDHLFARIDKMNPNLNAYITILHEEARGQAKQAEENIMKGGYKGPLHGIPVAIKDNYQTSGIRTTAGAKLFADFIPVEQSTAVNKLQKAGGIMLGKLHMHQLGGGLTGNNPDFGVSRNPWNPTYITGGSSSGSAAALAAGMATTATGTDTFGSIRIPAAMSGVYGLKPTFGLISTYGILPTAFSLDHAGPMARSVSDLALMLNAMAGYDPLDPNSLNVKVPDYAKGLNEEIADVKIGIPTFYLEGLAPDIEKLFNKAIAKLEKLGAHIKQMDIPELALGAFSGHVITSAEAAAYNYESLKSKPELYPQDVRVLLSAGALSSAAQYVRAQQARRVLAQAIKKALKEVDVLLGPASPITTPKISEVWSMQNMEVVKACLPFMAPANLAGIPSLAVPMGHDSNGLPAGMQFMGNHMCESLLLRVGKAWESMKPVQYNLIKLEEIL